MASRYKVGDKVTHALSGKKCWEIASVHHNLQGIATVYIIVPSGKNKKGFFTVARASNLRKVEK